MKKKSIISTCLCALLLLVSYSSFSQNNLHIQKMDGTTKSYALSSIKKISFTADDMLVQLGSVESYKISDIDKMLLGSPISISSDKTIPSFKLYPNPTSGEFTVECAWEIEDLSVYDMQGRMVLKSNPRNTQCSIALPDVPSGVYSVQVRTKQGSNISKLIKK